MLLGAIDDAAKALVKAAGAYTDAKMAAKRRPYDAAIGRRVARTRVAYRMAHGAAREIGLDVGATIIAGRPVMLGERPR